MRQIRLVMMVGALALVATSCEEDFSYQKTIDFEDVTLSTDGYYNGADKSGQQVDGEWIKYIQSSSAGFFNLYGESEWGSYWSGFAISSHKDTVTAGYTNQYSSISGSGAAGSKQFAVAYDSAVIYTQGIDEAEHIEKTIPQSLMITNSTYTYHTLKYGDMFTSKFNAGDWYKIIIKGYKASTLTGAVEFFLADFREGKTLIVKDWKKVDLSQLGEVDRIVLTFDSSDKTAGWLNTPAYACIDNLVLAYSEN